MPASGNKESVVFFGSGPVAAASLEMLAKDFNIEAVVTKPKPPHHRGDFPVLEISEKLKLKTFTVTNRQELSSLIATKPFSSQLGVLIDFGIIVAQDVIGYFPQGIVNSHFSILPELRGADPITFAILNGLDKTGVSLMLLVEKMDEGPLIAFGEYELPADITTPLLTTHLIHLSDTLLKNEVPNYLAGRRSGAPQTVTGRSVSYSRKLKKADGEIDWNKPAKQIEREIRAFIEWPKSRTKLDDKEVIITRAHAEEIAGDSLAVTETGKPFMTPQKELAVQTGEGRLIIEKLKPAGKNEMGAAEFARGYLKS